MGQGAAVGALGEGKRSRFAECRVRQRGHRTLEDLKTQESKLICQGRARTAEGFELGIRLAISNVYFGYRTKVVRKASRVVGSCSQAVKEEMLVAGSWVRFL